MKSRISDEKRVVESMVRLYCTHCREHRSDGREVGADGLCGECREVLDYALARLSMCRFGDEKTTCKKCKVHCYRPEMKERIRQVMRWSGPRMMLYHPIDAIRHLIREMLS